LAVIGHEIFEQIIYIHIDTKNENFSKVIIRGLFICSLRWGERWLFVLLILMELENTSLNNWKQFLYHLTDEKPKGWLFDCLMVFISTFNNISVISWRSVLLLGETGGPGEKYRQGLLSFNRWHIRYQFEDCVIIFKKHRSIMRNIMSCCYAQEYTYISLKLSVLECRYLFCHLWSVIPFWYVEIESDARGFEV
jgi:hypothetical protein